MISLEEFSELLLVLYSVPLRQERWERFLDLFCEHTCTRSGFLICVNHWLGTSIQAQGGVKSLTSGAVAEYENEVAPRDPYRLPMMRSQTLGFLDCETLVPTPELFETEFYRHIIAPAGLRYPSLVLLTRTLRRLEGISFWRAEAEGPMPAEGNRLLELLVPHLRTAMDISYAFGMVEARVEGAEAMADASRTATFLITERGNVLHHNAAAQALLTERCGLATEKGVLVATQGAMRVPMRNLLRDAVAGLGAWASGGHALSLERGTGRTPLQLLASPVPQLHRDGGCAVLLLVTDPDKPVDVTDEMMRAYYDFTRAETEIANGLLTGYSVEEIAALRRVTVGTTRFQMKSIFAKTGAARQADLIRKLLALPRMAQAQ